MHSRALAVLSVMAALFLLATASAKGAPLRQPVQVQVTSPEMGSELRGLVEIMGSASVPNFQFYKVEFGVGPNPTDWAVIGELHDRPVINGLLEVWDTTRLPDGVYTLRLQGVKQDGNWEEFVVRQVSILNSRPSATASPTVTLTRPPTPVRVATPRATATLQIIAPAGPLAIPTPTPTLSRPERRGPLPVDPKGWAQSLCYGGVAMGAVFVLLGVVLALRQLL